MSVTDVLMTRAATNGYSHPRPRDPGMWLGERGPGPGPRVWEWEGFKKCWLVTLRRSRRRAECWKYLRLGTEPGPIPALGTQSLPGPPLAGKSQVDIAEFSDSLGMETTGEWRHSEPYERMLIHGIFLVILHYLFLMCLILMTPNPSFSFLHGSPPIGENQNTSWSMITLRTHDLGPGEYNLWKVPAEGETLPWLSNLHLMLTNKVSLRTLCWVPRLGWRLWSLTNSWHSSASHYSQMAARGHKVNRGMFYLKHNLVDENMKSLIYQLLNNGCNIICDCWPAALTPSAVCVQVTSDPPPPPLHNKPHNNKSSRENITTLTYHQQPDIFKSSLGLENFACLSATQEEIEKVTNSSILKLGVCIIC